MKSIISAVDARKRFGELLNRVSLRHEEITIERAGKKIAKVVDVSSTTRSAEGKVDFRDALGVGADLWKDVDIDEYVRRERNEWD